MSDGQNPMDALNALMEERNRYEQWLAQLDARRGTTPPHVFNRVRGDYGERLENVLNQLAGRATELQETAGTLAERVASLYADETSLRDERAEAELRASVGEFTLEHAREVMQRCDEAISSLGAERATVGAEQVEYRRFWRSRCAHRHRPPVNRLSFPSSLSRRNR